MTRQCPKCKKELEYKSVKSYRKATIKNILCRSCVTAGKKRNSGRFCEKRYSKGDLTGKTVLELSHHERCPKSDLTDKIFNNWEVLGVSHRENGGMWYWNVKCTNCGYETKRTTTYVKGSKGCICCGLLQKGETGLNKVIGAYRDGAKQRGFSFELTKQQIRQMTSSPCNYCGCLPHTIKRRKYKDDRSSWGEYIYNGIDRIDNNKGYIFSNCVPCCEICNRSKGSMKFDRWCEYVKQFAENVLHGKIPFLS